MNIRVTKVIRPRGADSLFSPLPPWRWPGRLRRRKPPKIGFLSWFPNSMTVDLDRFRAGMREFGYNEQDYVVDAHFTGGIRSYPGHRSKSWSRSGRRRSLAVATPAVHIVKELTQNDPDRDVQRQRARYGLVPSLSRPGGNLTGVSLLLTDTAGKRLEFCRQIQPGCAPRPFLVSSKPETRSLSSSKPRRPRTCWASSSWSS